MKLKTILWLLLTMYSVNLFSQSKTEKDLTGIWKITSLNLENYFDYNYESKIVTLDGIMLWASKEAQEKTKADLKSTPTYYLGFNENESFAFFYGKGTSKGTFKVQYGQVIFEAKDKDTRHKINFKNSQEFTITSNENEMKENINLTFKKMSPNEILALKNDKIFNNFNSELQLSKSENEKKYNEEQDKDKQNKIRNAKEDREKADRLNREQSNTNKVYKSNISITKAIEIIREKFAANQVLNLIKNEKITTKYYADNNLYKCTLSVEDTELFFVSDYEGEKTFNLIIYETAERGSLTSLYSAYAEEVKNWFKSKGTYYSQDGWDDKIYNDDIIKVQIGLNATGNIGYVLSIRFNESKD